MSPDSPSRRGPSGPWTLTQDSRSSLRLATVAGTVLATAAILVLVTLQARRAERALDESTTQTLRDYTGYAGRMMGGELLRRTAERRTMVLAPVTGSSRRDVAPPSVADIAARGDEFAKQRSMPPDPGVGYFRIDPRPGGAIEAIGAIRDTFATRLVDTLRKISATIDSSGGTEVIVLPHGADPRSVAFAGLRDQRGRLTSIYGFSYTRSIGVAAAAERVFRETPLLPTSFAGVKWNYDTTRVHQAGAANDSLLDIRITDRSGNMLWHSKNSAVDPRSPYGERVVLSTSAGGITVEARIRQAGEIQLVPSIVRRSQRWSLQALLLLTALLAAVSLHALSTERLRARERRTEAMQQLALGLRHELNNALASVMLNAELLSEDRTLDASQRERLLAVVEQADRMRSVLRRLEKADHFDNVVPYLNEGLMVDLSAGAEHDPRVHPPVMPTG